MYYEHYWGVIFLIGILALLLIKAFKKGFDRHLAHKRRIAEREILQKERLLAMEKGLPLPEWDRELLAGDFQDEPNDNTLPDLPSFRTVALCIGLLLLFGGIGLMLAMWMMGDNDWASGLIPAMAGIGLLLFYVLTRTRTS